MAKHRAVIIGAGRIGAGYNWPPHPFVYTHADAYLKLKERVSLELFIDPSPERCLAATEKYGIPASSRLADNLATGQYDIVSVCVDPAARRDVFRELTPFRDKIKGVWCEKPWVLEFPQAPLDPNLKIQVNYIRRFDTLHQSVTGELKAGRLGEPLVLSVRAKDDIHTRCHFEDLARMWNVKLSYTDTTGTEYVQTEYELICTKGKVAFYQGGMSARKYGRKESSWFPGSLVPDGAGQVSAKDPKIFMELALSNLLDAVEGKAELKSPPY